MLDLMLIRLLLYLAGSVLALLMLGLTIYQLFGG